ncbi:MAG: putative CRISPR-associated protein [Deltaproteobacteria bacterium]|nr:putative CRISPR-associated protein [Deltaproteobacteria bacterium]
MASNVHVVSCGTSPLSWLTRTDLCLSDGTPFKEFARKQDDLARRLGEDREANARAERAVHDKPREASAEIHALWEYLERREVDWAYLVTTETRASQCAAAWIRSYLAREAKVARVDLGTKFVGYEASDDDDNDNGRLADFAARLQLLRDRTMRFVEQRKAAGDRVFIAAQGGYKPETGIMMLVGADTGTPVYYLHEEMRRTVTLPVLRYRGDVGWLRELIGEGASGPALAELKREHGAELEEAIRCYAVEARRDDTGAVVRAKLTAYGKSLVP